MSAEIATADIRSDIKFPVHLKGEYERIRYLPAYTLKPLLEKAQRFETIRDISAPLINMAAIGELVVTFLSGSDIKIALGGLTAVAMTNFYLWAKGARVQMIQDEIASRPNDDKISPDLI